jgi:hypothetical protein
MKRWEMARQLLKTGDVNLELERNYHKQTFITILWRALQVVMVIVGIALVVAAIYCGVWLCQNDRVDVGILTFVEAVLVGLFSGIIVLALQGRCEQERDEMRDAHYAYERSL